MLFGEEKAYFQSFKGMFTVLNFHIFLYMGNPSGFIPGFISGTTRLSAQGLHPPAFGENGFPLDKGLHRFLQPSLHILREGTAHLFGSCVCHTSGDCQSQYSLSLFLSLEDHIRYRSIRFHATVT